MVVHWWLELLAARQCLRLKLSVLATWSVRAEPVVVERLPEEMMFAEVAP